MITRLWQAKLIRNTGVVAPHLPSMTPGRNATDIAWTIDAVELLLTHDIDVFVLVANDTDFVPLARRVRAGAGRSWAMARTPRP